MTTVEVDVWRIVLLWQQYANAIMFGLIAFWWGRVQIVHVFREKAWGGSIGWLIAGVSVLGLGFLMAAIVNATEHYCMSIGWAYVPGCATASMKLRPLKSLIWLLVFFGAALVLRPTVRGRDWAIAGAMAIGALVIGAFVFWRVGGFDLSYR